MQAHRWVGRERTDPGSVWILDPHINTLLPGALCLPLRALQLLAIPPATHRINLLSPVNDSLTSAYQESSSCRPWALSYLRGGWSPWVGPWALVGLSSEPQEGPEGDQ